MRKLIYTLLILTGPLLNAQVDPVDQFFNKAFVPTLVVYDSITVSADSGVAFTAISTASQNYFTNGNIDTLVIEDAGIISSLYDGVLSARTTTITGTTPGSGSNIDRLTVTQDSLFRDSTISYYDFDGAAFQLFFEAVLYYSTPTGNQLDYNDVFALVAGNLINIGSYTYYYTSSNLLDSIYYTVSTGGSGDGYFKYFYDSSVPGKLIKTEVYEDIDNDGERDLIQRLSFKHNALNQIIEITELSVDPFGNLSLDGVVRFNTRKNGTISLPELGEVNIEIYPNPTFNYLQVNTTEGAFENYEIYNLSGQVVKSGKYEQKLELSMLTKGIYVLQLQGEHGQAQMKFEKM